MLILGSGIIYNKDLIPKFTITNNLTHCTSNNSESEIVGNNAYNATITADISYTLDNATVSILMGGIDITSTAYSNGVISIPKVTGDLSINIEAVSLLETTSAKYFTFDGNTVTRYIGEDTEIIIPRSYSMGEISTETKTWNSFSAMRTELGYNYFRDSGNYPITITADGIDYYMNSYSDFMNYRTDLKNASSLQMDISVQHYIDGDDYYVTTIGSNNSRGIISGTQVTNVTLLNNITTIESSAFYNCSSLTNITIPDTVTTIGEQAFYGCSSLMNVSIPDTVTSMGQLVFFNCTALTNVVIGNNVSSIGDSAFSGCSNLSSVTMGNNVTSIATHAFNNCSSLTSIIIPDGVTTIGDYAFDHCTSLESVTITENSQLTKIAQYTFNYCTSLTSIIIPSSVTSIGQYAFCMCFRLTNITISEGVTNIGYGAFTSCQGLTSITIPSTVTNIQEKAFENCSGLRTAYLYFTSSTSQTTYVSHCWFISCNSSLKLHIPSSVTSPTTAYGLYWNCYTQSGDRLTYYADL